MKFISYIMNIMQGPHTNEQWDHKVSETNWRGRVPFHLKRSATAEL